LSNANGAGEGATQMQLTANLIIGGLGTGIFTLPWSTAGASILPALVIIAFTLLLNAWTISILVQAAERHQTFDLGGLLGRLPGVGKFSQVACNCGVWFSMFLCLVGYTIVTTSCAQQMFDSRPASWTHRCQLVIISSACVLPLCFLDQARLSFTSVLGVMVYGNIFAFLLSCYVHNEAIATSVPVCYFGNSIGVVAMVSAMMQSVIVQMCVLPMYAEMKDRSPAKFDKVVAVSFTTLFFVFGGFAVFGYLAFGENVNSNILLSFPGTIWGNISRNFAGVGVLSVYPIMMSPMIAPIRNSDVAAKLGMNSDVVVNVTTVAIVAAVTFTAFFLTDLGILNIVNGAMSLGLFVALAPGLIGLNLLGTKSQHPGWRLAMYALIGGGIAMSILGLVYTDNYAAKLHAACSWGTASH